MNKTHKILLIIAVLLICLRLSAQDDELFFKAAGTPANPKVSVSWNQYNTYAGIADLGKRLEQAYPDLVKIESAGLSYEGRDILVFVVTNHKNINPGPWSGLSSGSSSGSSSAILHLSPSFKSSISRSMT